MKSSHAPLIQLLTEIFQYNCHSVVYSFVSIVLTILLCLIFLCLICGYNFSFHLDLSIGMTGTPLYCTARLRQRLHGTGSVWNRYEIGTDKPCVYTRPGGSSMDRICYVVPNGSTYEGDPMWNRTAPV